MSLKAKVEAIIYAAEEPVTLEQMAVLLRENVLAELAATKARAEDEAAESARRAYGSVSWRYGERNATSRKLPHGGFCRRS